jgi:drug/metabolite transporter (DMT)-like permease
VLASFTGEKPSRNVWVGCAVALAGCLFIAADASATDADDVAAFSFGEIVVIYCLIVLRGLRICW